jgi:hypothetical protein
MRQCRTQLITLNDIANERGDQYIGLLISPKLHYYVYTIHGRMESLSEFGPRIIYREGAAHLSSLSWYF